MPRNRKNGRFIHKQNIICKDFEYIPVKFTSPTPSQIFNDNVSMSMATLPLLLMAAKRAKKSNNPISEKNYEKDISFDDNAV